MCAIQISNALSQFGNNCKWNFNIDRHRESE